MQVPLDFRMSPNVTNFSWILRKRSSNFGTRMSFEVAKVRQEILSTFVQEIVFGTKATRQISGSKIGEPKRKGVGNCEAWILKWKQEIRTLCDATLRPIVRKFGFNGSYIHQQKCQCCEHKPNKNFTKRKNPAFHVFFFCSDEIILHKTSKKGSKRLKRVRVRLPQYLFQSVMK